MYIYLCVYVCMCICVCVCVYVCVCVCASVSQSLKSRTSVGDKVIRLDWGMLTRIHVFIHIGCGFTFKGHIRDKFGYTIRLFTLIYSHCCYTFDVS